MKTRTHAPRLARLALAVALVGLATVYAPSADAQQYVVGTSGELATGVQGGGASTASPSLARVRMRIGFDLHVDEFPKDIVGVAVVAELLPRASFGLDARYIFQPSNHWEVNVGGIAFIAPESMFGPSIGLNYRIPFSSAAALTVGPEANFFFAGSDLPDGTILWQGLLQVGVHGNL